MAKKPERPPWNSITSALITTEKKAGEDIVPATKVWVTDFQEHPFHVEWLRYEPDSPVTGPVRKMPHVAYRVDNIAEAAKGLKVCWSRSTGASPWSASIKPTTAPSSSSWNTRQGV